MNILTSVYISSQYISLGKLYLCVNIKGLYYLYWPTCKPRIVGRCSVPRGRISIRGDHVRLTVLWWRRRGRRELRVHVPASGGRSGSWPVVVVVVVTSTNGHGAGAAGCASTGAAGRAGPVVRWRRAAQLELTVLLDRAEYVGDGEWCSVRCVMIVVMMVMRFGAQGHR